MQSLNANDVIDSSLLVWVTGYPGTGKTTLGNKLKERKGWIHYDGDMFPNGGDPIYDTGIPTLRC